MNLWKPAARKSKKVSSGASEEAAWAGLPDVVADLSLAAPPGPPAPPTMLGARDHHYRAQTAAAGGGTRPRTPGRRPRPSRPLGPAWAAPAWACVAARRASRTPRARASGASRATAAARPAPQATAASAARPPRARASTARAPARRPPPGGASVPSPAALPPAGGGHGGQQSYGSSVASAQPGAGVGAVGGVLARLAGCHEGLEGREPEGGAYGYQVRDLEALLTRASPARPANLPMVLASATRLHNMRRTAEPRPHNQPPVRPFLPLGIIVNAVFKTRDWLYVRTAHGAEGYVPYRVCLPLGILPPPREGGAVPSGTADVPGVGVWENRTDMFQARPSRGRRARRSTRRPPPTTCSCERLGGWAAPTVTLRRREMGFLWVSNEGR
ncbi:hypothetical protein C7M84_005036 [Penaeus vannamei]|uniref:SH3 domain-containing protein n=1 Tax=Penaeus vannamei TaxID=6689 RepID=A0A3R7P5X0_PENVA|nr:hypothetical protein C7M84_005036 [Penaeus vannamei]